MVKNISGNVPISSTWNFNERLLNFNQYFASDINYVFPAISVYEQHQFCSSINVTAHKFKAGALTSRRVKDNFK